MSIEHSIGHASTVMWDQAHAEALDALRTCRAFVLVALPRDSDRPSYRALSCDLSPEGFIDLLNATAESTDESAFELARRLDNAA
jgi:hypothetical protein